MPTPRSLTTANALFRWRTGTIASIFLLAAGLALFGIARTDTVYFAPQHGLYIATAILYLIAAPGPIIEPWDLGGSLFLWNAIGWSIGLMVFGFASVGSLAVAPLILAAFAISFWPRESGMPLPIAAYVIAAIGGMAICWMLWGDVQFALPTRLEG